MILFAFFWGLFFLPSEINVSLLNQREEVSSVQIPSEFHYLGSGRQMVAFQSTDQQVVLKLFKKNSLEFPWYLKLPIMKSWFQKKKERIHRRQHFFLQNYRLAFLYLPEETGVLCVHQGYSETPFPRVALEAMFNRSELDLDKIPFVLQKKGDASFIGSLEKTIGTPNFQKLLDQFFAFHKKRIALLIADSDRDVLYNYQMLNGKLLYIDAGGFYRNPNLIKTEERMKEWWRATHRLRRWIQLHAPDELSAFDQTLNAMSAL